MLCDDNDMFFSFSGAFNGRDRTGLAVDPKCPHTVVCTCVNGKVRATSTLTRFSMQAFMKQFLWM